MNYHKSIALLLTLVAGGLGCTSQPSPSKQEQTPPTPTSTSTSSKPDATETAATAQSSPIEKVEKLVAPPVPAVDVAPLLDARLQTADLETGWVRLFDGNTLVGWEKTTEANWRVDQGAIVVDTGAQGFLSTKCRYADFELQLEYKAAANTNSGVFLRCAPDMKSPATDCYELNIAPPSNPFPTGSLVERHRTEPATLGDLDPEQWHTLHALVDSKHVQTWINGVETANYMDEKGLVNGKIMLQFREGPVAFRNIRLRPIGYSLIPADNLDSWYAANADAFKFNRTQEGFIELEGGRADLELLQQLQNFCVQLRVQTLSDGTNSGVFFRCIPGSTMDGYECQINNLFDGDRSNPKDFGTGAIFRRVKARAVLSDDHQDTFITISADGPNISTWVQGVQVVDWKDERTPNDNPREGYRSAAGSLQLQAHDPTCKVVFKSLLVSPIEDVTPPQQP